MNCVGAPASDASVANAGRRSLILSHGYPAAVLACSQGFRALCQVELLGTFHQAEAFGSHFNESQL